jgi:hypothetical protein
VPQRIENALQGLAAPSTSALPDLTNHHQKEIAMFTIARKPTIFLIVVFLLFLVANVSMKKLSDSRLLLQTTTTSMSTTLLAQLRAIKELHTGIASVQTVITSSETSRLLGLPVGSTKLLYVAVGQVRAGIDLAELDESCISTNGNDITVTLPAARILDSKIDVGKSYVYDVQASICFAPDSVSLQGEAERRALREVEQAALACGLLEMAGEQAAQIARSLLSIAGAENVRVTVRAP